MMLHFLSKLFFIPKRNFAVAQSMALLLLMLACQKSSNTETQTGSNTSTEATNNTTSQVENNTTATVKEGLVKAINQADGYYKDFVQTLSYFPDNPNDMTESDKATFGSADFWPIQFRLSTKLNDGVNESFNRTYNFLRYVLHTKVFAEVLNSYVLVDRGILVDNREVLLILREGFSKDFVTTITNSDINGDYWTGTVRNAPPVRILTSSASIPVDFKPSSWYTTASVDTHIEHRTTLDYKNFKWYDYGVGLNIGALLIHEILHNMGYTHSEELNKTNVLQYFTKGTEDVYFTDLPTKRWMGDVNYGVQYALNTMFSVYFNHSDLAKATTLRTITVTPTLTPTGTQTANDVQYSAFPMTFYPAHNATRYAQ